jgi:hypothetical protein
MQVLIEKSPVMVGENHDGHPKLGNMTSLQREKMVPKA